MKTRHMRKIIDKIIDLVRSLEIRTHLETVTPQDKSSLKFGTTPVSKNLDRHPSDDVTHALASHCSG